VLYVFLRQRQTVNRWYYHEVLKRLRENVRRKRPELWRNNSWFLHHDNAPAHAMLLIRDFSLGTRQSLPEPGQVSRVAEEAQLCSGWPNVLIEFGCVCVVCCRRNV
jgi:hypothetical protein